MKQIIAIFLLIGSIFTVKGQENKAMWPELNAFHDVLSATFHPSEKNDLKPINTRAGELNAMAMKLAASKPPAELNNVKIKKTTTRLAGETKLLLDLVSNKKADRAIKQQLTVVHNTFHEIVEQCQNEKK